MDCRTAREALLEAEPAALGAGAPGPLGEHLSVCPACAAAAARIASGTARLAAELKPRRAPEPLRAGSPAVARRGWRVAALAAAAVVTLLLTRDAREPAAPPAALAPEVSRAMPVITVPEGSNAMVFRTADPHITVVWYY